MFLVFSLSFFFAKKNMYVLSFNGLFKKKKKNSFCVFRFAGPLEVQQAVARKRFQDMETLRTLMLGRHSFFLKNHGKTMGFSGNQVG